jgi:hypothetical protein
MARDWEAVFSTWTGRASDAEQTRYENTRDAIKDALRVTALSPYTFDVYAKGSYPAFTNVVRDSDVDIAVELTTFFQFSFSHDAVGASLADVGGVTYKGGASLGAFKDDIEHALVAAFGRGAVDRGSKAIHIREDRRSLKADVVPCVTFKGWTNVARSPNVGIKLLNDNAPAKQIINYPKQHLERGTAKNDRCNRRYKRVVRILKTLENEMVERDIIAPVPSFLIESAVWNVDDHKLRDPTTWVGSTRGALAHIFNGTRSDECITSNAWLEANGIKYLFHEAQPWTWQDLHAFADAAWDYVGFD